MRFPQNQSAFVYAIAALFFCFPRPAVAQRGRIDKGTINSPGLAKNLFNDPATRPFKIYLPPSYDTSEKRYPVVYALHGWPGNEDSLLADIESYLDANIRQRKIGEVMVVFVNATNR